MLKRLLYTLALLGVLALTPQTVTLVLTLGKAGTFAVLGTCALVFWVAGVANVLERTDQ